MSQRPVDEFLSRLQGVKQSGKGWTARCPSHEDKQSSLSIREGNDAKVLLRCFAGCKTPAIVETLGLRMRDLFSQDKEYQGRGSKKSLSVAALAADKKLPESFLKELGVRGLIDLFGNESVQITYLLADGVMAQRQRTRTALRAKEGSRWSKGSAELVPYGLWKLKEAQAAGYCVMVEGESDCWTSWFHGFPALGIPGADLTKTILAEHLEGIQRLYVIREPDKGGETFAAGMANRLRDIGWSGEALVVALIGAKDPNDLHCKDAEGFKALFQKALDGAVPLPEPPPPPPEEVLHQPEPVEEKEYHKLPSIRTDDGVLKRVTASAWAALRAANDPAIYFRYGGIGVRIEEDDERIPVIRELSNDRLRHTLARVAFWYRENKKGEITPDFPPMDIVRDMQATPNLPLPIVTRIVEAPVFAPDGQLQTNPGYHSGSRTYYVPAAGFVVPEVPNNPSAADIEKAKGLLEELLCDFPFVDDAERAHAVALLLLHHARELITGPTPLHMIEAPSPGTGKGLLTDVLTYPAMGRAAPTLTEGRDEDEWRKRITAKLMTGPSTILIDNVRSRLDSAALSAALTSPAWEDRILGQSKVVCLSVRCAWIATGNNPGLSTEMSRRTLRIRIDSKQDRPWLRKEFRHPNLKAWAREHRGELVWAALTLIQAWLAAGRPLFTEVCLGMFESWSTVMGGILKFAGFKGFLGNLQQLYEDSDAEGTLWRGFVRVWWDKFAGEPVGVSQLFELVNGLDQPLELGRGSEKSQKTRLGQELVKMRDRQLDGIRIVLAGERQRAKQWKLVPTDKRAGEPVNPGELFPPQSNPPSITDNEKEEKTHAFGLPENGSPTFTGSLSEIDPGESLPRESEMGLPSSRTDWPVYWRDLFEERAGILEFDEGLARAAAEKRAEELLRDEYARQENRSLSGMGGHP